MSVARLADVVHPDQVRPVGQLFIRLLDEIIAERDVEEQRMRQMGAGGVALAAHREATDNLRTVAARWERALNPESSVA